MDDLNNRESRQFYIAESGEVSGPLTGYRCGEEPVWFIPGHGSMHEKGGMLQESRGDAIRAAKKQINRLQEQLDEKKANLDNM